MTEQGVAWANYYRPGMDSRESQAFKAGWDAVIKACGGTDHVLRTDHGIWTLQHPVTERIAGTLFDCPIPALVGVAYDQGDIGGGEYKVWLDRGALCWEAVE